MQSSIQYRPRNLDQLIGQERLVKLLRGQYRKKKLPQAIMLLGPKGSGKTTVARIIALSVQCRHQDKFGNPCKACRLAKNDFPIYELNAAGVRGVEDVENYIKRAEHGIVGKGKRKVFILDEAHRLSGVAQDVLLVPFEKQDSNLWIICSTKPEKIVDTLRSRCQIYNLRPLDREGTVQLVTYLLAKESSELEVDALADALCDNGIHSGRLIANAVDKYISGATAEEAADVEGSATINGKVLIRTVGKGDWAGVAKIIDKGNVSDARLLRNACINYLFSILKEEPEITPRTKTVAEAIRQLAYSANTEDSNQFAALTAELHIVCDMFAQNSI